MANSEEINDEFLVEEDLPNLEDLVPEGDQPTVSDLPSVDDIDVEENLPNIDDVRPNETTHCEKCGCDKGCECGCEQGECSCTENEKCNVECEPNKTENYLKDLLRVQAEFDNYRKRMITSLSEARQDGFIDAIEQFIPALDSFKMATDMITDKNTLMGIKFIEKGILDTLSKMGVETIDASGKFNPEFHQAIDTDSSADIESGYIVKEAYKGFMYKGKVIRYSQVIVKK